MWIYNYFDKHVETHLYDQKISNILENSRDS
jgi:hypothetical protein